MSKITTDYMRFQFLPSQRGFQVLLEEYQTEIKEQLLKPYIDDLPAAPPGYRIDHSVNGGISAIYKDADIYDRNGRTGEWQRVEYSPLQQAIINKIAISYEEMTELFTKSYQDNNEAAKKVYSRQSILTARLNKAYKKISDKSFDFDEYIAEFLSTCDDQNMNNMSKVLEQVSTYRNTILWDEYVDYVEDMAEDYAQMIKDCEETA